MLRRSVSPLVALRCTCADTSAGGEAMDQAFEEFNNFREEYMKRWKYTYQPLKPGMSAEARAIARSAAHCRVALDLEG
jgi:hypothetical protein